MGRQAVVSGGGTGIGAAVARGLVDDGYQVVIVGRRKDVLDATARELGDAVRAEVADLTSVSEVERLVSTVDGQVDVLVNNAGGFDTGHADGLAGTVDWWRRVYDSNVVRRAGRPADIAAAVRYLVGPDSGYVTGQILSVNGGVVLGR
jgi:3-oxoacyl-[acyl-carrier protein] reductase